MDDREAFENPALWPMYPFLPIRRRGKPGAFPECRVISADKPLRVVEAGLYALPKTKAEFDALPFKDYETLNELLADGWIVD